MKKIIILFLLFTSFGAYSQSWHSMGIGVSNSTSQTAVFSIKSYNNKILIGGGFDSSGSTMLNGIALWNNNQWQAFGTGFWDLYTANNRGMVSNTNFFRNTLYLVGGFHVAGGTNQLDTASHGAGGIVKWDGTAFQPLTDWGTDGFNGGASALEIYNDNLYIGGNFNYCYDTAGAHYTTTIAKWNDTAFSSVGEFHSNSSLDFTLDFCIYNNNLVAGGYWNSINGSPYGSYGYIGSYNDTIWSPFGTGFNNYVGALTVFNGELYAGGKFTATSDNSTLLNHVAKWNGSQWLPVGEGFNNEVAVLYADTLQNILYAGGAFTQTGLGQPAKYIAKWNGTNWEELGGGTNYWVSSLYAKDSNLYVGGFFTQVGSTTANHIAVWGNHPVGINEIVQNHRNIKIYPNPTNGDFTIEYELKNNETGSVKIMDVTGKLIASYVLEKDKTNITISEAALKNGVYFYQIIINGNIINADKLVIIKN